MSRGFCGQCGHAYDDEAGTHECPPQLSGNAGPFATPPASTGRISDEDLWRTIFPCKKCGHPSNEHYWPLADGQSECGIKGCECERGEYDVPNIESECRRARWVESWFLPMLDADAFTIGRLNAEIEKLKERAEKAEASLRALENVICLTDDPRRLITENGGEIPPVSREKLGALVDRLNAAESTAAALRRELDFRSYLCEDCEREVERRERVAARKEPA